MTDLDLDAEAGRTYAIVQNDEEQLALWPTTTALPPGWQLTDFVGTREDCLEHVGRSWVDIRPASLRNRLQR